jgi:hypothetical protein
MTFPLEDKRDKIRSQLLFEITHPTLWYEPTKNKSYKPTVGLYDPPSFPKKGSGLFYSSLILAEQITKELESRGGSNEK